MIKNSDRLSLIPDCLKRKKNKGARSYRWDRACLHTRCQKSGQVKNSGKIKDDDESTRKIPMAESIQNSASEEAELIFVNEHLFVRELFGQNTFNLV